MSDDILSTNTPVTDETTQAPENLEAPVLADLETEKKSQDEATADDASAPEASADAGLEAPVATTEAPAADVGEPALPAEGEAVDSTDAAEDNTEADASGEHEASAPTDTIETGDTAVSAAPEAGPAEGIAEQPSADDAAAAKPLSAQATDEVTPAVDAMPEEAQQHMAQWLKSGDEAEPAQAGQLPTAADLPGTPEDATAVSVTDVTDPSKAVAEGEDAGTQEDTQDGEAGGEGVSTNADGGDADSADSIFGQAQVQHGPLVDVAGDGLEALKTAAEQAALAQNHLSQVPVTVLELEHRDLLADARHIIGEMLRLAARIFERRR